MNKKISLVNVLKNGESGKALTKAAVEFSVFSGETVEFTKEIDRPDDYYLEGDPITFTIKIKNVGDKRLVNFSLQDELEEYILPFETGYEVTTSVGQIASYTKPVMINNITLKPDEEAVVTIKGLVGAIE